MQGFKNNKDYTAQSRALAIMFRLMNSRRPVSQSQLASEMECSNSTIIRTMYVLECQLGGSLVIGREGRAVTYSLKRDRSLTNISLDAEGLSQLALCWKLIRHTMPRGLRNRSRQVLEQVLLSNGGDREGSALVMESSSSLSKGYVDYGGYDGIFNAINRCMAKDRVMDVTYARYYGRPPRTYPFAPKRLVQYNGIWYVIGWSVTDDDPVRLRHPDPTYLLINRIRDAVPTDRSASGLDPVRVSHDTFGFLKGEPFTVRARFSRPGPISYVADRIWAKDQRIECIGEDEMEITFTSTSRSEVKAWIMSFGVDAKLLEPADIREAIAEDVRRMAARLA